MSREFEIWAEHVPTVLLRALVLTLREAQRGLVGHIHRLSFDHEANGADHYEELLRLREGENSLKSAIAFAVAEQERRVNKRHERRDTVNGEIEAVLSRYGE